MGVVMRLSPYGKRIFRNFILIVLGVALIISTLFFTGVLGNKGKDKDEPETISRLDEGFVHGLVVKSNSFEGLDAETAEVSSEAFLDFTKSLQFSVLFVEVDAKSSEDALKLIGNQAGLAHLPLYIIDDGEHVDPKDYKKLKIKGKANVDSNTIQFADYEASMMSSVEIKDQNTPIQAFADVLNQGVKGYVFTDYEAIKDLSLEIGLIASNLELLEVNVTSKGDETSKLEDQRDHFETSGTFETLQSADEFFSNSKTAQIGFSNKPVIKGIKMEAPLGSILSDPTNEDVIKTTTVKDAEINVVGSVGSGDMLAYELTTGDYLMAKYTKEIPAVKPWTFTEVSTTVEKGYEVLSFKDTGTPMPYIFRDGNEMIVTFVGATFEGEQPIIEEGLFQGLEINNRAGNMELRIPLDESRSWGYLVDLSDNTIKIRIKESVTAIESYYQPLKDKVIVVDAGHGGKDPGSLNPNGGKTEAQVNLELSALIEKRLVSLGAIVINTRTDDTFVSLWDRVNIMNDNNGDYFVSVHHNASVNTGVNGVEMYYAQENDKKLSETMAQSMSEVTGRKNRGPYLWRQYVLRSSLGPSVLIEAGFMSNDVEFKDVQDPEKQILSAGSVADNVVRDLQRRIQRSQ